MAQAVGTPVSVLGHDDTFGGHFFGAVDYIGPTSYVQGGDAIDPHPFGCPNSLLALISSVDQSNVFRTEARALYSGAQTTFQLVWIADVTGTYGGQSQTAGTEVAAGTNLSTYTVRLAGIGF
jgi:hypothetical protein